MERILKNAKNFEYIGTNQCKVLYRAGTAIKLENLTDSRIERMIAEDPYWSNQFQKTEKVLPAIEPIKKGRKKKIDSPEEHS